MPRVDLRRFDIRLVLSYIVILFAWELAAYCVHVHTYVPHMFDHSVLQDHIARLLELKHTFVRQCYTNITGDH